MVENPHLHPPQKGIEKERKKQQVKFYNKAVESIVAEFNQRPQHRVERKLLIKLRISKDDLMNRDKK